MKTETVFVCQECGKQLLKWMGRCPGCGEWNTVAEKDISASKRSGSLRIPGSDEEPGVVPLSDIQSVHEPRMKTGLQELDRVLGGGIVRRSVILIGGDPGIGKTTLLMQGLGQMAQKGEKVLYVSGEESFDQLKLRANRLGIGGNAFLVLVENELETIMDKIEQTGASVIVLDSVQSVFGRSSEAQPGSVSQVREVAGRMLQSTKRGSSACFIVGHVTKEGDLAGPKLLEHMVDAVLYFEGERGHPYRILRAVKNRFGSISEIGVFEMSDSGLIEVANPSELFLSERPQDASGSAVIAIVEGTRPILAEIQALVTGPVPGPGRRTCLGVDSQRLALIVAVLEKKLGLVLGDQNIFLNAVGGIRATEPAADLGIAAALLSSFMDRSIPPGTLVFGEIGLAGEVRSVSRVTARINEAARLGFSRIIAPSSNLNQSQLSSSVTRTGISRISDLGRALFD
ncbi:MAG: DNA repair protein RadA [Desulfomonile tiedjei]|uniref:DNA repair protein RadA n=1 Tax=Desulfomonile tiedjei TaxID=2358 RepID=A0A9D6V8H7_9BACT|nr:DNA repair protein RadA [Desulfomonile tiedjei]